MYDYKADPKLSKEWKTIFYIYEQYGVRGEKDPEGFKEYFKTLSLLSRMSLGINLLAFLLGPIYFLFKGMYRQAIVLLCIIVCEVAFIAVVQFMLERDLSLLGVSLYKIAGYANAITFGVIANTAYYNFKIKGYRGWSPFVGLSRKSLIGF